MFKKGIALILTLGLLLTIPLVVYADEEKSEKVNWSIDDCIERALKNNIKLKIKAKDYEKSRVERGEAVYLSDKISDARDTIGGIPYYYFDHLDPNQRAKLLQGEMRVFSFEGAQGKEVAPKLKEAEELIAQKNLDLERQNLRLDIERAYHSVLLAQDNLANAKTQLQRSKEQLKNAEVSYKNGVVAKDTVIMARAGYANSEQNLFSAEKNLQLAKMSLNKQMGRGLTAPLNLTTKFVYTPEEPPAVETKIEAALRLRPEVISLREMGEVTKLNERMALKYYAENAYVYQKAKVDADKAQLGIEEAEASVELAVRAAYLNFLEASEKLKTAELMKEAAAEAYRITDLKHKSQVSTTAELLEASEKLYNAELLYTSCVFNYNVAKAELENWAGKGLE